MAEARSIIASESLLEQKPRHDDTQASPMHPVQNFSSIQLWVTRLNRSRWHGNMDTTGINGAAALYAFSIGLKV